MKFRHKLITFIHVAVLISIVLITLLLIYNQSKKAEHCPQQSNREDMAQSSTSDERRLPIFLTAMDSSWMQFSSNDLNMGSEGIMRYDGVTDVTYVFDGKSMELVDALQAGYITFADISAYAHADAKNGICGEHYQSKHGLTHFTYEYPEFDLRIIHDIYETPDGQQHLINELVFYAPGSADGAYTDFRNEETGYRLDREDWGVSFEITEVSSTGLKMHCIQSNGQQIGELHATGYSILVAQGGIPRLDGSTQTPPLNVQLRSNDTSIIEIDWTEIYGKLPSGEYELLLDIKDLFDESRVHPLMVDYHDWQFYELTFTIP